MKVASGRSAKDWEEIERKEHDKLYRDSLPFQFKTLVIDIEKVKWWQDYCYKPGRRKDRGHKTKRVFEILDLDRLKGKRILDVGCGNGQYSVFFALLGAESYGFDLSLVGIEVASKMAQANNVADHCHFSVQSASQMNYKDEFFDFVIFHEVLHHVIKYPNVREETVRVLKPNGKVICSEGVAGNPFFRFARRFTMRGVEAKGDVILQIDDLLAFAEGFASYEIELMSLFFMSKRIFRRYMDFMPVRWLMYSLKKLDDILLRLMPSLKRYCGECILILEK